MIDPLNKLKMNGSNHDGGLEVESTEVSIVLWHTTGSPYNLIENP